MRTLTLYALCGGLVASLAVVAPAEAEIVYLASGRTMSVSGHRRDGDLVTLYLRSGGEVTCGRALIARIEPDEVPYPEPVVRREPTVSQAGLAREPASLSATPYWEVIDEISTAHGIDPQLVRAVIEVESGYRPRAVSPRGAMGLMQLMPETARQYHLRDPFDPRTNVEAGVRHLKSLLDRFDLSLALAAYNSGAATVSRFGGIPPYRETRAYVSRITSLLTRN